MSCLYAPRSKFTVNSSAFVSISLHLCFCLSLSLSSHLLYLSQLESISTSIPIFSFPSPPSSCFPLLPSARFLPPTPSLFSSLPGSGPLVPPQAQLAQKTTLLSEARLKEQGLVDRVSGSYNQTVLETLTSQLSSPPSSLLSSPLPSSGSSHCINAHNDTSVYTCLNLPTLPTVFLTHTHTYI